MQHCNEHKKPSEYEADIDGSFYIAFESSDKG